MSKFLKSMIVLLAIVAMAAPAFAADNLTLGGQMRVGAWYLDDGGDSTTSYIEHRLRVGGKFSVTDGVSVTFRKDFSDQQWGSAGPYGRDNYEIDRAHLDITKGMFHLRAGQLYFGTGGQFAVDTETTGAVLDMNFGAAKVQFAYLLPEQNGAGVDDNLLVLNASHKTDLYSANVFVANAKTSYDNSAAARKAAYVAAWEAQRVERSYAYNILYDLDDGDYDVYGDLDDADDAGVEAVEEFDAGSDGDIFVYGFGATFNLDAVKLETGLSIFTGDVTDTIDATVTQFNLKGTMAASETMSVGATFYYAKAADADEAQITYVGNGFNGYDVTNYGALENEYLNGYANRVYDFTGAGSGVMGGQIFASLKANDATTFYGSLAYLTPEDDEFTGVDSDLALNVSVAYKIMDGVSMATQLQYVDRDDAAGTDAKTAVGARLYVNF